MLFCHRDQHGTLGLKVSPRLAREGSCVTHFTAFTDDWDQVVYGINQAYSSSSSHSSEDDEAGDVPEAVPAPAAAPGPTPAAPEAPPGKPQASSTSSRAPARGRLGKPHGTSRNAEELQCKLHTMLLWESAHPTLTYTQQR